MTISSQNATGITARVSAFVAGFDLNQVPAAVVERAKELIFDTVGVTLAASEGPMGDVTRQYVSHLGGKPQATVIGKGAFTTATAHAAMANGANAAMLDYDDTSFFTMTHPSGVLVPTVLALGEELQASGRQVIEAYIVGFEAMARVCTGFQPKQYLAGRHSPGTVGVMMSAGAASKLMGLDQEQTAAAYGIAASLSGALRGATGSMTKPFHSGAAAMNGIMAAHLAKRGLTANFDTFERDNGYCMVTCGGPEKVDIGKINAALDRDPPPYYLVEPGVGVKIYPTGTAVFCGLDALLAIIRETPIQPEQVESITFAANPITWDIHCYNGPGEPRSVEEARYSIKYPLAVGLVDRECGLRQLTMERINDPVVRDLIGKIRLETHPNLAELRDPVYSVPAAEVTIRLNDGRQFSRFQPYPRSYPKGEGITHDELAEKYRRCAGLVLAREQTERSLDLFHRLERLPNLEGLIQCLQAP